MTTLRPHQSRVLSVGMFELRYIGTVAGRDIWQDVHTPRDISIETLRARVGLSGWWLLGWGTDWYETHEHASRWLAALTPADICDLYTVVEAAIANPPEAATGDPT